MSNLLQEITALIPTLHGWTSPERCCELAQLVLEHHPHVVVEIGTFAGRAAFSLGMALREQGFGKCYTIDPFKTEATLESENEANRAWWSTVDLHAVHRTMVENIWRLNLDEWVIPIRSGSQDCWTLFREIDLLLIDGNHSELVSCRDVELYLPKVSGGGIIYCDDANWDSTKRAMALLELQCVTIKDAGQYRIFRKK